MTVQTILHVKQGNASILVLSLMYVLQLLIAKSPDIGQFVLVLTDMLDLLKSLAHYVRFLCLSITNSLDDYNN